MRGPRSSRQFEPLGALRARSLGLSDRRSRELELLSAWARVAGPELSALARPLRLRRGVVELELLAGDEERRRRLVESLAELGAELAAMLPGLRIKRVRLADAEQRPAAGPREAEPLLPEAAKEDGPLTLEELMERYLARAQKRERTVSSQAVRSAP
jgi:hypothetical protein